MQNLNVLDKLKEEGEAGDGCQTYLEEQQPQSS
jgi:hypothetical protein